MEGETGVMKQLQSLWHILKLIDREMFAHLSQIGAESLHFAFRMLLVLFRRELSFNDSLCMWEVCSLEVQLFSFLLYRTCFSLACYYLRETCFKCQGGISILISFSAKNSRTLDVCLELKNKIK